MIQARLTSLRKLFDQYQITGYIIPSNDEYMSEYTPECFNRLKYITGFTGSNGIAIICQNTAMLFTDGRYLEQSKQQLDPNIFQIFDLKDLKIFIHMSTLGYDPKLFTATKIKSLPGPIVSVSHNLVDLIWSDRPAKPSSLAYAHDQQFAGESHVNKIAKCRNILVKHNAEMLVINAADSICWLLNIRAADILFTPIMLSRVLLTKDQLYLFIEPSRISTEILINRPEIIVLPEGQFENILSNYSGKILIDENQVSSHIMSLLTNKTIEKITDPCQLLKACKNAVEIKHAIDFHVKDAIALCEFFCYLSMLTNIQDFSEYDLGVKLTEFRSQQSGYISDSFSTICGFKENGAIIHYKAENSTAKKIVGHGLLLIDSGAQYQGCTTDVTRVIAIGVATNEQKRRYTQVLKGHIALASIKFPKNIINGGNLDVLARQFLWQDNLDYPHGTGHGVGSFLSVHEGPQNISLRSNVILQEGMILSNEPGYYKTGEFGIRIENLMYVKNSETHNNYLEFSTLTLVPYNKALIDFGQLNAIEIDYIEHYNQKINQLVYPSLSLAAKKWLRSQCF